MQSYGGYNSILHNGFHFPGIKDKYAGVGSPNAIMQRHFSLSVFCSVVSTF